MRPPNKRLNAHFGQRGHPNRRIMDTWFTVQARTWVTLLTGHMGDTCLTDMGDSSGSFLSPGCGTGAALGARSVAEHGAPLWVPAALTLWGIASAATSLVPNIRREGESVQGRDAHRR